MIMYEINDIMNNNHTMKKSCRTFNTILLSILLLAILSACAHKKSVTTQFITVKEGKLYRDGKPYYFLGTNLWYGCYLGSNGSYGNRDRLTRELDALSSRGINNLRLLAASEKSTISNALSPAIQNSPGVYNEELLEGLDFLLAEMGKRHMNGVLFLNNFWEWSGGMGQYMAWAHGGKVVDPVLGKDSWPDFMAYSDSFYADSLANAYYRQFIHYILNRKNTYNGLLYKNDPVIMAWELANEPRGGEGRAGLAGMPVFTRWVDETAGYIHSLDSNHLVTTGSEGTVGCKQDTASFLASHKTRNIDYLTFHLWAKNWGWFDARNIKGTLPSSKTKAINYLNLHMQLARQLSKPIVLEEFGMERDSSLCKAGTPVTARDEYYRMVLKLMSDTAASGGPFAGCNFWGWGGEGRPAFADCIYRLGDPYLCDPPQEGQGLNSVFDSDSSTIRIIRNYADKMNRLSTPAH